MDCRSRACSYLGWMRPWGRSGHPRYRLYVRTDDLLKTAPERRREDSPAASPRRSPTPSWSPWALCRPCSGTSARRGGCVTPASTCGAFPLSARPVWVQQAAAHAGRHYGWLVRIMAIDTSLWADDVWVIDSTPVECGRSRDTVLRSDLAGWAMSPSCRQQAG